jgi:hypothetical protein
MISFRIPHAERVSVISQAVLYLFSFPAPHRLHYHFQLWILGSSVERPIRSMGESSPHKRLLISPLPVVHRITSLVIGIFLSSCCRIAEVTIIDVEIVEAVEAISAVRASQLTVTVVGVVVGVVAAAVGVGPRLLLTEPPSPEEYANFIGPLGPAIATSTARTGTRQGSRHLRPSHRIIPPTFSRWRG